MLRERDGRRALQVARVDDDASLRDWYRVSEARADHDAPDAPRTSLDELRSMRADGVPLHRVVWLVGRWAGTAVACGSAVVPEREGETTAAVGRAFVAVAPGSRGLGHGRAMALAVVDLARSMGCAVLRGEVGAPLGVEAPGDRLAASLGAEAALDQLRRQLRLDAAISPRLATLEAEVADHVADYELVSWAGAAPEALVDGMAALLPLVERDSPTGALALDERRWDADRVRAGEAVDRQLGRRSLVTGAVHRATGALVGYTSLLVPSGGRRLAVQRGTVVRAQDRGHRLGLAVKVANVRQLVRAFPDVERVETWNALDNAQMIAVNERLGFVAVERHRIWQLRL